MFNMRIVPHNHIHNDILPFQVITVLMTWRDVLSAENKIIYTECLTAKYKGKH